MPYKEKSIVTLPERTKLVDQASNDFLSIVDATKSEINWLKEKEFALQHLANNDYLMQQAKNNPNSFKDALLNVASIGISLNPALKLAYLVPRNGRVVLDLSYLGLIKIAVKSNNIKMVQTKIVYENDEYINQGFNKEVIHKYNTFSKNRGEAVGVYCIAKTNDGDYLVEEMSREDIYNIRARSIAYQAYLKDNKKLCPWVTDEFEMWRKTVVRRASKYWITDSKLKETIVEHVDYDYQQSEKVLNPQAGHAKQKMQQLLEQQEPEYSQEFHSMVINIHDCLSKEELEEVGNNIANIDFEDIEVKALKNEYKQQLEKVGG